MAAELIARSMAECHMYMNLRPCRRCGEPEFRWSQHGAGLRDGLKTSWYEGACPTCGTVRRFDFVVLDAALPPPALGGPEPSRIIDPGEFLAAGDAAARYASVPSGATPDQVAEAYDAAADAVAAVEEVLKFIPPGEDAVPVAAFTSPDGLAMRTADPARFGRDWLDEVRTERRRTLEAVSLEMDAIDWDALG